MKNSGDKHVIVWVGAYASSPSSRWFRRFWSNKSWMQHRLEDEDASIERTDKFSEAYVFDSFEEAYEVFNAPAVKKVYGGRLQIRYYTDKEYFKEVLSRG